MEEKKAAKKKGGKKAQKAEQLAAAASADAFQAEEEAAAAADAADKKESILMPRCYVCGKRQARSKLKEHQLECIQIFDAENAALPPDQKRPRPSKYSDAELDEINRKASAMTSSNIMMRMGEHEEQEELGMHDEQNWDGKHFRESQAFARKGGAAELADDIIGKQTVTSAEERQAAVAEGKRVLAEEEAENARLEAEHPELAEARKKAGDGRFVMKKNAIDADAPEVVELEVEAVGGEDGGKKGKKLSAKEQKKVDLEAKKAALAEKKAAREKGGGKKGKAAKEEAPADVEAAPAEMSDKEKKKAELAAKRAALEAKKSNKAKKGKGKDAAPEPLMVEEDLVVGQGDFAPIELDKKAQRKAELAAKKAALEAKKLAAEEAKTAKKK